MLKTPLIEVYNEKPDLRKKEPPLVNLQVSNPVTYLKSWWKRVMGGEGIDFHFRIKPLTAIALTVVIATFGFGVGRFVFSLEKPYLQYVPPTSPQPSPTPNLWRQAAFTGKLQQVKDRYYLLTTSDEAIYLQVPENIELQSLLGRRVFAKGSYHEGNHILVVVAAEEMEVLPKKKESVPIVSPQPSSSSSASHSLTF